MRVVFFSGDIVRCAQVAQEKVAGLEIETRQKPLRLPLPADWDGAIAVDLNELQGAYDPRELIDELLQRALPYPVIVVAYDLEETLAARLLARGVIVHTRLVDQTPFIELAERLAATRAPRAA